MAGGKDLKESLEEANQLVNIVLSFFLSFFNLLSLSSSFVCSFCQSLLVFCVCFILSFPSLAALSTLSFNQDVFSAISDHLLQTVCL